MPIVENSVEMKNNSFSQKRNSKFSRLLRKAIRNWQLYVFLLPSLIFLLIFCYVPDLGLVIAFQKFSPRKGFFGSEWVGWANFIFLFDRPQILQIITNTVLISTLKLIFGMPVPIIFALLLNEVRLRLFKRSIQTITYFPHFLSWVVYGGLMLIFLGPGGPIISTLESLGLENIRLLTNKEIFRGILVVTDVLKGFGWSAIIYLASITSIDPTLYEAARVDGANRWQQMWYITLPSIRGTIAIIFILNLGSILNAGFDQVFVMYNPTVYSVAEIIDTYVYSTGIVKGKYSLATAMGLFKSVIGATLVIVSNKILKKMKMPTVW